MKPLWLFTMARLVESPSPVPFPTSFVVKNGSKIRSRNSGGIPGPVSATVILTYVPGRASMFIFAYVSSSTTFSIFTTQLTALGHRVTGVDAEIHEDLMDLRRIRADRSKGPVSARDERRSSVRKVSRNTMRKSRMRCSGLTRTWRPSTPRANDSTCCTSSAPRRALRCTVSSSAESCSSFVADFMNATESRIGARTLLRS